MVERRTGAGHQLSGVLERSTPPRTSASDESPEIEDIESAEAAATAKGRGASRADREPSRKAQPAGKAAKKPKGRTVYLSDDLFERILVQAHRRDKTISEYVSMILERQVPDHRTVRADATDEVA
ncbi:MAG: hypothetical protein JO284_19690 [Planctomycetaceae bacterium]|nr:hypothetical protein [Planctomycetaceae bacterium]